MSDVNWSLNGVAVEGGIAEFCIGDAALVNRSLFGLNVGTISGEMGAVGVGAAVSAASLGFRDDIF